MHAEMIVFTADDYISRLLSNDGVVSNVSESSACFALSAKWRREYYCLSFVTKNGTIAFYFSCE